MSDYAFYIILGLVILMCICSGFVVWIDWKTKHIEKDWNPYADL